MRLSNCSRKRANRVLPLLLLPLLAAQSNVLSVDPADPVSGKRGENVVIKTSLRLREGYHLNSHQPEEAYLIPLRLTWDVESVETVRVDFPAPKHERYAFSEKPLSVFTGDFVITSTVKPKVAGFRVLTGKLRYQACSHNACLPPKTIEIKLPADFR